MCVCVCVCAHPFCSKVHWTKVAHPLHSYPQKMSMTYGPKFPLEDIAAGYRAFSRFPLEDIQAETSEMLSLLYHYLQMYC